MLTRPSVLLAVCVGLAGASCSEHDPSPGERDAAAADVGDAGIDAPAVDAAADADPDVDRQDTDPQDSGQPDTDAQDALNDATLDTPGDDVDTGEDADPPDSGEDAPAEPEVTDIGDWEPPGDLSLPPGLVPSGDEFMIVVLPDTQIYAQRFPETFDSQTKWVADHAAEYRIVMVSHVGDIVQTAGEAREWEVADAAYDWLRDIDMPHGFSMGGHDTSWGISGEFDSSCSPFARTDCDSVEYRRNFGPQHYEDDSWYGGASPSEKSNYQLIEVEGMQLLFLHLPQDVPAAELEWANEVLDAHPGALVHLTTHRYLFDYRLTADMPRPLNILPAGRFNEMTYTLGGQSLMWLDGTRAEDLFRDFVARHPNIWAVHCGHVDAEFRQNSVNAAGLPVYEILVDFQDMADGGGGWLRGLVFRPSENEVEAFTFSTLSGELRDNGAGFEHSIDILESYSGQALEFLEVFGLDQQDVDELITSIRTPGEQRDQFYDSLYTGGDRDSRFAMTVDFDAYIEASR